MVIDGRQIAERIIAELRKGPVPQKFLAAILVGEDPASVSFVGQKERVAKELGVDFHIKKLEANIAESTLIKTLKDLGEDKDYGGIVLQLPLPAHFDRAQVITAIPPEKDVDVLRGENTVLSPAVGVVDEVIKNFKLEIKNYRAVVVGMGFLVGQPIATWLKRLANSHELAEVITLDIGDDLAPLKNADLVVLGVGSAGLVHPAQLKNDALVVDFGYSRSNDGTLHGDFDPTGAENITYTPTPGGTGPILVAKLFENFYRLNQ